MATLLHSDSRRLYSWLWDSHNSPRNSKWLQENLADMDAKVKQMIKLITEDTDSFARRAEMYYKKRPELMKLVEELYRAYRALAERYDHVTIELRHAHRTIAEAFPDQVPCLLADQLPSTSSHSDAETLKLEFPNSFCVLVDNIDSHAVRKNSSEMMESDFWRSKKGLKQLSEMLESGAVPQNSKFPEGKIRKGCLNLKPQVLPESEHYSNVKTELQNLKNSLAKIQAEKEEILYKHQETLRKLAEIEKELHNAQDDAGELDDQASRAEIEINILKEALAKLVSEKDASLMQYNQCMEKISNLESIISRIQEDAKGIDDQKANAEIEAVIHKGQFSKLEAEKEALLLQYKQCLEQISALEIKVLCAENDAGMLYGQIERAESEVTMLKEAVSALTEEKETTALQYKRCLETIALLEAERSHAQEEVKELHDEIKTGSAKLRSSEEKCLLLEKSNQSLQKEADDLSQDIELRDQELVKMQLELGKLQTLLQDEHLRVVQVEATLHVLQQLQTQSEEEQRTLTLELKNYLQMLKDLEICNQKLEKEITRVMEENRSLNEENFSSNLSLSNLQNEITSLKEIKIKLEQDFIEKVEHSNTIQKEISSLKEEMKSLDKSYRALILQVESVGLNPVTLPSSVKELQDENIQLKKMCEKEKEECMVLAEKLQNMDKVLDKNAVMESSISELNFLLQVSKEKIRELQESCQLHQGEKANLVAEKATLLSQLQIMTENMKKLLEKNTVLEKTLSSANTELGILKEKLKGLEEFCKLLSSEKSSLLDERSFLVSRLEDLELRLGKLERRFTNLEENHAALEKEKESIIFHIEELWSLLSMEKKLHADYVYSTEARLTGMEGHIHNLQRENTLKKEEFEEELRKTISAEVEVFILLKFIQDLEERNLSLTMECQKHIEASKLSDNLIFELEGENFEQEVEVENLLNVIEKLGSGIQQIYRALQADPITAYENKNEQEEVQFPCILNNIEDMKSSLWKSEDEKYQLLVEKMILLTLIEQQGLGVAVLKSEKNILEEELRVAGEQHAKFRDTEHELMDINRQLMLDARNGEELEKKLKNELKNLNLKLVDLQQSYLLLLNENSKTVEENKLLLEKFSELKKEKHVLEEESSIIMQDTVALSNTSLVLEVFGAEKAAEFKSLVKDFNNLQKINSDINIELEELHQRLKLNEIEHLHLNDTVETLNKIISGMADFNSDLNIQMGVLKDSLIQKEIALAEAEQKHKDTQKLNFALSRSVEDLKSQHEGSRLINEDLEKHIFELSKENKIQSKEIERLHGLNTTLESEVAMLQEENNRYMLKEESLCLELQDKEHEFELWEADATTFYFDLQISVFREVLLQNKLKELGEICENLECKNSVKIAEIEQMKSIINSLESEIGGLKAQLSNYVPVIASLRDDVASLENNAQNWTKLRLAGNEGRQPSELTQGSKCQKLLEDSSVIPLGISDLEIMQNRIRTVLKSMEKVNDGNTNFKIEAATARAGKLKLRDSSHSDVEKYREGGNGVNNMIKIGKNEFENFEARDGILMKDIQLDRVSDYLLRSSSRGSHGRADDHMLELWETSEQDLIVREAHKQSSASMGDDVLRLSKNSRHRRRVPSLELQAEKELGIDRLELSSTLKETYHEGNKRKFLEKIASDSQILMTLLSTIEELRKRMDRLKRSKKAKDVEYEIVRTRLQEAEEAVLHLAAMEDKLKKDVSEPHLSWYGGTTAELEQSRNVPRTVTEQAREQSEKIAQLQLDMQNIQQFLQKLEIESKSKGNDRFSGSRTGIFLREFILSGNRTSKKRKKFRFCGCVRPSSVKK